MGFPARRTRQGPAQLFPSGLQIETPCRVAEVQLAQSGQQGTGSGFPQIEPSDLKLLFLPVQIQIGGQLAEIRMLGILPPQRALQAGLL